LTSEGKVNVEALVRDGDFVSQVMADGLFTKLSSKADRILVKDRILVLEFRNAIDVMMGVAQVFITRMAKASLMPKKAFGMSGDAMGKKYGGDRGEVFKAMLDSMNRTGV
jgi:hypothetical protein